MTIPEIKLSEEEMREAVHAYLSSRGISVPVEAVDKNYSGFGAFRVTLKDPEEEPVQAAIEGENP